jgi:hypothetical protein
MPGNNVACRTLMLSLMRSARINSYVFHGGYEPGVSSDTGLELGKRLSFQYALMPHARGIGDSRLVASGPGIQQSADRKDGRRAHAGPLPKQWGMLKVSHANAYLH